MKEPKELKRVFAVDLSPSDKRLGVGVGDFTSKLIFFKTDLIKKLRDFMRKLATFRRR